jgi:hypothetical protein
MPLSQEQLEQSALGPKFENVSPEMLFSSGFDAILAARIYKLNPARYRELRQQHRWNTGQDRRPDNFYD